MKKYRTQCIFSYSWHKAKEITENGLVGLFDIIQWKEAYQFENFGRFRRLQKEDKRLMAKINNKV